MEYTVAESEHILTRTLFSALKLDDVQVVRECLEAGLSPEVTNELLETPLYVAARCAGIECLQALLDAGAKVNRRLSHLSGEKTERCAGSALNHAINYGRLSEAEFLLDRGADPRVTDVDDGTALHYLVRSLGDDSSSGDGGPLEEHFARAHKLLLRILAIGLPINQLDGECETALQSGVVFGAPLATIEMLLLQGADPAIRCALGNTAMHRDWYREDVDLLRALVAAGADINSANARGRTALFFAQDLDALEAITELGGDVHARDNLGGSALAFQVEHQLTAGANSDVLGYLLARGLDPAAEDYTGDSVDALLRRSTAESNGRDIVAIIGAHRASRVMRARIAALQEQPL
jgi:ankyrin repeat protein